MYNCLNSDSESDDDVPVKKLVNAKTKSNKSYQEESKEIEKVEDVENVEDTEISKVVNQDKPNKKHDENKTFVTLFADKIEITIAGKKLINESDIVLNSETKYFLMGNNGTGKTTLMKYLYERLKSKDILMIDQDVQIDSGDQTVRDFILRADAELYDTHQQTLELEELEELTDEQQELYIKLSEYISSKNWDRYEAKSNQILNGLGFKDPNRRVSVLSGGWRMRVALGRALLYEPRALFLDESNNHLDLNASIWLTNYLESYPNTIVMITHQVGFINALANYIWYIGDPECTGSKLYTIRGKYNNLQQFLEQTNREMTQKYEKLQKTITDMRKKTVTKAQIDEVIKKANAPRPPKEYSVSIKFEDIGTQLGLRNIIEFRNVTFSYDNTKSILNNIEFSINLKSRFVIVGDNGAGKTTLFKLCMGQILPTSGEIIKDERITIAHFHQLTVDTMPLDMTAIEYMQSLNTSLSEDQCRAKLGRIGLKKMENLDIPKNKIGDLSGGQKARLAFAIVQLFNPSIILLDEPTNNLDITSIEALITAINEFDGGIVIITHDTYLIESIENYELYEVKNHSLTKFKGDFEEYKSEVVS